MMRDAFWETFRTVFTDRTAFTLLFVSAILYSFFYPSAYSGQIADRIPIAVVDQDNSAMSRTLLLRIAALQQVEIFAEPANIAAAKTMVQSRDVYAVVFIPDDFEREILRGEQSVVSLYGNGAYLLRSNTALTGIGAALADFGQMAAIEQSRAMGVPAMVPIIFDVRPLFNSQEGYGSSVVPGVIGLIIQQTLLMGMVMLCASRREKAGRLRTQFPTLLGVALAFGLIGLINFAYFTGFVFWFQDYPRGGNFMGLLVGAPIYILAIVAFALFVGSFVRTRERVLQLWIVTSLPLYFLSGLSWPVEATPPLLHWMAKLIPTTAGINLMVATNQMDANLSAVVPEIVNLIILIALYGSLSWLRYKPMEQKGHPPVG